MAAAGASTFVAGDGQQIIGVRHFGIPLQHGFEVEHHVGQALNVGVLGLRHAVLQRAQVIAHPHIALIERRGVAEFGDGVFEFAVLDVVPRQDAVGQSAAHGVAGKLVGIVVGFLFRFRFDLFVGGRGRRGQVVQFFQAGLAAFGNADLNFGIEGARVGLGKRLGGDRRIVGADTGVGKR